MLCFASFTSLKDQRIVTSARVNAVNINDINKADMIGVDREQAIRSLVSLLPRGSAWQVGEWKFKCFYWTCILLPGENVIHSADLSHTLLLGISIYLSLLVIFSLLDSNRLLPFPTSSLSPFPPSPWLVSTLPTESDRDEWGRWFMI